MNGFLLDTNVVSETVKPRAHAAVVQWLDERVPEELFLAAITLGELIHGTRKLGKHPGRARYEQWIHSDLTRQFEGRILSFDPQTAVIWGEIMGAGFRSGRPRPAIDAQIAATARQHDLTLVTRNVRDFRGMGVPIMDPWDGSP